MINLFFKHFKKIKEIKYLQETGFKYIVDLSNGERSHKKNTAKVHQKEKVDVLYENSKEYLLS